MFWRRLIEHISSKKLNNKRGHEIYLVDRITLSLAFAYGIFTGIIAGIGFIYGKSIRNQIFMLAKLDLLLGMVLLISISFTAL